MIEKELSQFIQALRAQLFSDGVSFVDFIKKETYIDGHKYSFKNHEFQEYILRLVEDNPGGTFVVKKCSQIGISEVCNRLILALMAIRPGTGVILSLPSKSFAQEVFKTRISTVISDSPALSSMVCRDVDSASVKLFNNNSIVYALGGNQSSKGTLLNRKVGTICIDEFDRQDIDVITGYTSRTSHVPEIEQYRIYISTPTVSGIGIDSEYEECSIKHIPYIGCKCGHEFVGDYYTHVRLPGYEKNLRFLTKFDASKLDTSRAYLECPECKGAITPEDKRTVWKIEINPEGVKGKIGVALDPFVAMGFISMKKIVEASFTYTSLVEFTNQSLGKTADLSDSSISVNSIHFLHDDCQGIPIAGLDLGKLNYWVEGVLKYDTSLHVKKIEIIPLSNLKEFVRNRFHGTYFGAVVMDAQPYTSLVYELVREFPQLFSAIYVDQAAPKPELFTLTLNDKYNEVVRQVAINKNMIMNNFAETLNDFYTFEPTEHKELLINHYTNMRKTRDYRFEDFRQKWVKPERGDDHLFHASIYFSMAAKLAQAGLSRTYAIPVTIKAFRTEGVKS